ncbi:hypothetical protein EGW08_003249 [Elysia chlorotica]|uniref:Uncharacterized protein n=1 Tax=Elysia chlorotica TaxID=188477 RepID=A0A3S0ZY95_ELYCH|nr:hypothetical protein EGW08_003249 [Elysia chlorotica]
MGMGYTMCLLIKCIVHHRAALVKLSHTTIIMVRGDHPIDRLAGGVISSFYLLFPRIKNNGEVKERQLLFIMNSGGLGCIAPNVLTGTFSGLFNCKLFMGS